MREISGFVFQDDVLFPTMTVNEIITLSALLRLPQDIPIEARKSRIEQILKMFHLDHVSNTKIGSILRSGVSGGERKRVCIAMEVIVNPIVLFLDEPTSGLDSFTAYSVMDILSHLAHDQNRTIVTSIHQPSSDIFKLFDDLMLLSEGKIVYYGEASKCLEYFNRQGYICPPYTNPADFLFMHVLKNFDIEDSMDKDDNANDDHQNESNDNESNELESDNDDNNNNDIKRHNRIIAQRLNQMARLWLESPEYSSMKDYILNNQNKSEISIKCIKSKTSNLEQFKLLSSRASLNTVRNPIMLRAKLFQTIFLGVFLGLVYIDSNSKPPLEQIQNKAGVLFFITVQEFFSSSFSVISVFFEEKAVIFREYQNGYYNLPPYFISKVIVELPYPILSSYLLLLITYYMVGLNPGFGHYLLAGTFVAVAAMCGSALGFLTSISCPSFKVALSVLPAVTIPLFLFTGLFLNVESAPAYLSWIRFINPMYYAFTGLAENEFIGRNISNCNLPDCSGNLAVETLGLETGLSPGVNLVLMFVIYIFLVLMSYIVLYMKINKK